MSGDALPLGDPFSVDSLASDWERLALLSRRIFSTREWAKVWWEAYGAGRQPLVLPLREENNELVAILPLFIDERGPLRLARFVGHGAADELGPVCDPALSRRVAELLRALIGKKPLDVDILLFDSSPEIEGWGELVDGTTIHTISSPAAALKSVDWDAYFGSLSRNVREQFRRRERRLNREHSVRYRITTDPAALGSDLDTFFALHRARWSSASSLLAREVFYRRFAAEALAKGWLRLSFLEVDDQAVATHLDFRYAGVHFQYNSGRDPRWEEYSVGTVLRVLTMRDAVEDGVTEYRFLRGGEEYKWRFADYDRGCSIVALAGSRRGQLVVGTARTLARSHRGRRLLMHGIQGR